MLIARSVLHAYLESNMPTLTSFNNFVTQPVKSIISQVCTIALSSSACVIVKVTNFPNTIHLFKPL